MTPNLRYAQKMIQAGLCPHCGGKEPLVNKSMGEACRLKHNAKQREKFRALRNQGLCRCGKGPRVKWGLCLDCLTRLATPPAGINTEVKL